MGFRGASSNNVNMSLEWFCKGAESNLNNSVNKTQNPPEAVASLLCDAVKLLWESSLLQLLILWDSFQTATPLIMSTGHNHTLSLTPLGKWITPSEGTTHMYVWRGMRVSHHQLDCSEYRPDPTHTNVLDAQTGLFFVFCFLFFSQHMDCLTVRAFPAPAPLSQRHGTQC